MKLNHLALGNAQRAVQGQLLLAQARMDEEAEEEYRDLLYDLQGLHSQMVNGFVECNDPEVLYYAG